MMRYDLPEVESVRREKKQKITLLATELESSRIPA